MDPWSNIESGMKETAGLGFEQNAEQTLISPTPTPTNSPFSVQRDEEPETFDRVKEAAQTT
jgi:hypothetical protein